MEEFKYWLCWRYLHVLDLNMEVDSNRCAKRPDLLIDGEVWEEDRKLCPEFEPRNGESPYFEPQDAEMN